MGLGVVDPLGSSPRAKWEVVVGCINSGRLRGAALDLLSGRRIVASDDGVQVAWFGGENARGLLILRDADPASRHLLQVMLEALSWNELEELTSRDPAGIADPLPDAWVTVIGETMAQWELFNCRVSCIEIARDGT